ncbi:MAG: hypothetical protein RLW62_16715 [Gammaproteobacteria bacterium]
MSEYRDVYLRVGDRWLCESPTLDVRALAPRDEGLARRRIAALRA